MKKISLLIAFFSLIPAISFGAVITFGNYDGVTINDLSPASPYPSTIEVSGLANVLLDVNVTLLGLSHTYPDDLWIALVGPTGASVVLMANAGVSLDISNAFLTFDNEAASPLPNYDQIESGTYQVSQFGGSSEIAPTPAGYFTLGTDLSIFDGLDPNGTWSLYVFDDFYGDSGSLLGWTLNLETAQVPLPGAALLLGAGLVGLVALPRKRR